MIFSLIILFIIYLAVNMILTSVKNSFSDNEENEENKY